jgi:dTDP-4-amino-4,6-dideoxygalactose transaminase
MPLQFGGFLVGMKISDERMWHVHGASDKGKENEILGMVAAHWQPLNEVRDVRQKIWHRYAKNLACIAEPYFELPFSIIPGAFILKLKNEDEMKRVASFVRRFGIEVGNWYHHSAIFLPCHQRMTDRHVDYVCGAILANYRENCGIPHE